MSTPEFTHLLKSLEVLPNLKQLSFKPYSYLAFCCPVASAIGLLEATPTLEKLSRLGSDLSIDVEAFCEALQKTTKSTAFVVYRPKYGEPINVQVAYQSSLNHHGHAMIAEDLGLSIQCLCSLHGHTQVASLGRSQDVAHLEQSLWYGLLREAPSLWANAAIGTVYHLKRKRPASSDPVEPKEAKKKK